MGWTPVDPIGVITGAAVCAGAALLPDADHPSSTVAAGLPGGRIIAGTIGGLTGGHRKGMHSLVAVLAVMLAAIALSLVTWTPTGWDAPLAVGPAIAAAVCIAVGTKCVRLVTSWALSWLIGIASAAAMMWFFPDQFGWLPACIGVGYLAHLVGDTLTTGGVPWLWPVMARRPRALRHLPIVPHLWPRRGAFALPVLGNAGSRREWAFSLALGAFALWVLGGAGIDLMTTLSA
jgi:membrane-bound metal-dependent hydrolase YbcI (DUF457 family)